VPSQREVAGRGGFRIARSHGHTIGEIAFRPERKDAVKFRSSKRHLETAPYSRSQAEVLKAQQERQERFEKEVREALVRLETRRVQERLSPRGGIEFEDTVVAFIAQAVRGAPCIVEATDNTPGLRTRCKKGDLVLRFTQESAFALRPVRPQRLLRPAHLYQDARVGE
jgi:hypothetical protein